MTKNNLTEVKLTNIYDTYKFQPGVVLPFRDLRQPTRNIMYFASLAQKRDNRDKFYKMLVVAVTSTIPSSNGPAGT